MTDDVTRRPWWDWRKMPGARYIAERGPVLAAVSGRVPDDAPRDWKPYPHATPDPTDPATLGCLLALARELTGDQTLHASCRRSLLIPGDSASGWTDGPWDAVVSSYSVRITIASGLDEWSALVAACDAAWGRR